MARSRRGSCGLAEGPLYGPQSHLGDGRLRCARQGLWRERVGNSAVATAEIDSNGICHLPSDEIRPSVIFEFYQDAVIAFQNVHTLCKQSSWSHYSTLIKVENENVGRLGGRFTAGFLYNIVERANDTYRELR